MITAYEPSTSGISGQATATEPGGPECKASRPDRPRAGREHSWPIPAEIDYVYHAAFSLPRIEEKLFCTKIEVPKWRDPPEGLEDIRPRPRGTARLSGKDEAAMFLRYNYCRYMLSKLIAARRRRSSKVRRQEITGWRERAMEARSVLVRANMALVVSMAKRAQVGSVEFPELVSEGNMALLRCVDKFDVSRGFKFSTYACRAILKSFSRLAERTERYRRRFPVEYDPALERGDNCRRKRRVRHESDVDAVRQILVRNRASLSDMERTIVIERFAIGSREKGKTFDEIGKMVGLTKERVRQIQKSALTKLRSAFDADTAGGNGKRSCRRCN